jgi:cob(I)alamin adenosyltransferase
LSRRGARDPARRRYGRGPRANVSLAAGIQPLGAADATRLERDIDAAEARLPALTSFVLPGGAPQAAALHFARTVCRRAERSVLSLDDAPARPDLVIFLNRLSDLLFVLARRANAEAHVADVPWTPRKP